MGADDDNKKANTSSISLPEWDNVVMEYERRVEPFTSSFIEKMIRPFQNKQQQQEQKGTKTRRRLLDVGGGTGLGASIALEAGFDVTTCDVSSSMVQRVQERFPRLSKNVMCVDGQSLPFQNEFEYAMGAFSVIFFPSPLDGLKQIRTALVDGGEVVIAAWGNGQCG
jgi:SAM-dependent methyltransferase